MEAYSSYVSTIKILARALQALSDPYCQSDILSVIVCVRVCVIFCLSGVRNEISRKLSDLGVRVRQGTYRKVSIACRLMTSTMTSRDSYVTLVTSQSSKSSYSETRIRINDLLRTL